MEAEDQNPDRFLSLSFLIWSFSTSRSLHGSVAIHCHCMLRSLTDNLRSVRRTTHDSKTIFCKKKQATAAAEQYCKRPLNEWESVEVWIMKFESWCFHAWLHNFHENAFATRQHPVVCSLIQQYPSGGIGLPSEIWRLVKNSPVMICVLFYNGIGSVGSLSNDACTNVRSWLIYHAHRSSFACSQGKWRPTEHGKESTHSHILALWITSSCKRHYKW